MDDPLIEKQLDHHLSYIYIQNIIMNNKYAINNLL